MSKTVNEFGFDWASFAKGPCVQSWLRKDSTPLTNKKNISTSQVFNEASSARKPGLFLDRMIFAISCCRFVVQDRVLSTACDIFVAQLARVIQQYKLSGI